MRASRGAAPQALATDEQRQRGVGHGAEPPGSLRRQILGPRGSRQPAPVDPDRPSALGRRGRISALRAALELHEQLPDTKAVRPRLAALARRNRRRRYEPPTRLRLQLLDGYRAQIKALADQERESATSPPPTTPHYPPNPSSLHNRAPQPAVKDGPTGPSAREPRSDIPLTAPRRAPHSSRLGKLTPPAHFT
jgi:hypothetical protein